VSKVSAALRGGRGAVAHAHSVLGDIPKRLAAVRAFAALPEAPALAAANKRISNILKKAAAAVDDARQRSAAARNLLKLR
jgi:glycyl-tRNA synthetase beta subunit